jgi:hypothetical protein
MWSKTQITDLRAVATQGFRMRVEGNIGVIRREGSGEFKEWRGSYNDGGNASKRAARGRQERLYKEWDGDGKKVE